MVFNEKLAGMMLLLADKRTVTRTELNKLLFFSDVVHFLRCGAWISGVDYFKKQFGPVPDNADQVRSALVAWDYLSESTYATSLYYQYDYQTREDKVNIEAVREPFQASEIKAIADVAQCLRRFSATELSNRSHEFEPWRSALPQGKLVMDRVAADAELSKWLSSVGIDVARHAAN